MTKLHIELTTRCTLECPACPRTVWKEIVKKPITKSDLDIENFARFMDCPAGDNIKTLVLCGDYGDSIYYPQLIEFIKRFRDRNFEIMTNGSFQKAEFWHELNSVLTEKDSITFAIDGLEDTNHLYRRNSDWTSTMQGLEIAIAGPAKVYWQTIVFSFNQDKLDDIKHFAESKGAKFFTLNTHRYGDDRLKPSNETFIETDFEYKSKYQTSEIIEITPQCEEERVITADGYLLPCCWIRHPKTFYKSDLWIERDTWLNKMAINDITLDQGLALVKQWKDLVTHKAQTGSDRLDVLCKMKCRKDCKHVIPAEIRDKELTNISES